MSEDPDIVCNQILNVFFFIFNFHNKEVNFISG